MPCLVPSAGGRSVALFEEDTGRADVQDAEPPYATKDHWSEEPGRSRKSWSRAEIGTAAVAAKQAGETKAQ